MDYCFRYLRKSIVKKKTKLLRFLRVQPRVTCVRFHSILFHPKRGSKQPGLIHLFYRMIKLPISLFLGSANRLFLVIVPQGHRFGTLFSLSESMHNSLFVLILIILSLEALINYISSSVDLVLDVLRKHGS